MGVKKSASELISKRIADLGDWRGETLGNMRKLIREADPEVVEEWKWRGVPVWSHDGILCTGEAYRKVVKLTFFKGASLKDPARLFNSSLDGNARRAIDLHEGEEVDDAAFQALIRQAVALNKPKAAAPPTLLAGGNPRIAKADGDVPVQAYLAALSGWKGDVGRRLDALLVRSVSGLRKAVKWNSPFYGVEGRGWFLSLHAFTNYLKVAFFRGAALRPVPPGASKQKEVRYLDLRKDDPFDEAQLTAWILQAAALPGWVP